MKQKTTLWRHIDRILIPWLELLSMIFENSVRKANCRQSIRHSPNGWLTVGFWIFTSATLKASMIFTQWMYEWRIILRIPQCKIQYGRKTVFLEMSTLFYAGLLKVWGNEMSFVGWIIVIIAVTSSVVQARVWQVESGGMSQSLSKWTQNSFWPYDDGDLCTAWRVLFPRIPLIDCLLSWIQRSFLRSVA